MDVGRMSIPAPLSLLQQFDGSAQLDAERPSFDLRLVIATSLRPRCAALGCSLRHSYRYFYGRLSPGAAALQITVSHAAGRLIQVKLPCFTLLQCCFTLQGPHCDTIVARDGQSYRPHSAAPCC